MLILTRRRGEQIVIAQDPPITITILGQQGGQVKVGVEAPKEVAVHRKEIYDRIEVTKGNLAHEEVA